MEMRTVYRYENADGKGPYNAHWSAGQYEAKYDMLYEHRDDAHPAWSRYNEELDDYEMPEAQYTSAHLAGCDSREALDAWFDGWHKALEDNGFRVVEYTVPAENVIDGRSGLQVAFKPCVCVA